MKLHSIVLLVVVFGILAGPASAQGDQIDPWWWGTFELEELVPGTPAPITHVLTVFSLNGEGYAILRSSGYQTDETIICRVADGRDDLIVTFVGYPNGGLTNAFGTQQYHSQKPLFVLHRHEPDSLQTHWGQFTLNAGPRSEDSFQKID